MVNDNFGKGVRFKNGAWRYRPSRQLPEDIKERVFKGKSEVTLGKDKATALRKYADYMKAMNSLHMVEVETMNDLFDEYEVNVTMQHKKATQVITEAAMKQLRPLIGHLKVANIKETFKQQRFVFKYQKMRGTRIAGCNQELATLARIFKYAVDADIINYEDNPMLGKKFLQKLPARKRMIQPYSYEVFCKRVPPFWKMLLDLALALGIRKADLLSLEISDIRPDGVFVDPIKTRDSSGVKMLLRFDDPTMGEQRREAVAAVLKWREQFLRENKILTPFLLPKPDGSCYYNKHRLKSPTIDSRMSAFMRELSASDPQFQRFSLHDVRRNVVSQFTDLSAAAEAIGDTTQTTQKHYASGLVLHK